MDFKGQNIPGKFVTTTGQSAWHAVHKNIGEDCRFDLKLALERSGEDYQVEKTALKCPYTGETLPDIYGLFRSDNKNFFGTCKSRYNPVSNYDTLKPIMEIMSESKIGIESMGFWETGHVAVNFKMMETEIVPDDKHVHYMGAVYGHDGKTVITYLESTIRMVCSNTVNNALKTASAMLKTKHTINVESKLNQYGLLIDGVRAEITDFTDRLKYLSTKQLSVTNVNKILDSLYGEVTLLKTGEVKNNPRQQVLEAFERNDGDTFKGIRGTAYNLYNGITEVNTHKKRVTIQGEYDKSKEEDIKTSRRILDNLINDDQTIPKFFDLIIPVVN